MKKKGLMFSVLSTICVSLIAGCGNDNSGKLKIDVVSNRSEYGTVSGSGYYNVGDTLSLKIKPNKACSPSLIKFTNGNTSEITDIELLSQVNYPNEIEQAIKVEAPGTYKVIYNCSMKRYKVKYKLLDGPQELKNIFDTLVDGNDDSPLKLDSKLEKYKQYTITEDNKKFVWYIDQDATTEVSYEQLQKLTLNSIFEEEIERLNSDKTNDVKKLTLYAKVVDQDAKDIIKNSIDNFVKSKNIIVKNDNGVLTVKNYDSAISGSSDKLDISWKVGEEQKLQYLIQSDAYYETRYTQGNGSYDAGFRLTEEQINEVVTNLGDFMEIANITNEYLNGTAITITADTEMGTSGINYTITDGDNELIFCIKNQTVNKITKKQNDEVVKELSFEYPTSDLGGLLPNDPKNMSLINLFTNADEESNLYKTLEELFDYSTIAGQVKGTRAVADTLVSIIENNDNSLNVDYVRMNKLKNLLKEYSYEFIKTTSTDSCEGNVYNGVINGDMNVCIKVNKNRNDISKIKSLLEAGNYKITTTIIDDEFTVNLGEYQVNEGQNLLETTTNPGLQAPTWAMIGALKKVSKDPVEDEVYEYYRFKYDETEKEYLFYNSKAEYDANIPFIKIKLVEGVEENKKIQSVTYFSGKNTYVNVFDYNNIEPGE